jgi:hypothetical protein
MKAVIYFLGESYTLNNDTIMDSIYLAQKTRNTYNCNVELMLYDYKRVKVLAFKKREVCYPYSRERLERYDKLF